MSTIVYDATYTERLIVTPGDEGIQVLVDTGTDSAQLLLPLDQADKLAKALVRAVKNTKSGEQR